MCDVVPRRAIVRVEALGRAVVCDDEVVLDVVHLRFVARRAVLDGREVSGAIPPATSIILNSKFLVFDT